MKQRWSFAMKSLLIISSLTVLTCSCNTFTERKIIYDDKALKEIFEIGLRYNIDTFRLGDNDIYGLNSKLQKLQIDYFEIKVQGDKQSEKVMELDSIVIFTQKSRSFFDNEDNIIYDFAKTSRQTKSFDFGHSAEEQKKIADRWYTFSTGFD